MDKQPLQRGLTRRTALAGMAGAAALAAPPFISSAAAQGLTKIAYQTGWLPGTDKGGLYQAQAAGIYKSYGFEVDIRAGGPQLNVNQIFMSGSVDFADTDSFRVLSFVSRNLPAVAVAAFGQKSMTALMSHPGVGNDSLESLKGKPILISTIARQTYWNWLKGKYGYADEQARPWTNNLAPFLVDKNVSVEGFINAEPLYMRKAGVEPVVHVLADHGYENYSIAMLAHPKMVAEKPEVVQRFVEATTKGWASYLNDPKPGNALMQQLNPNMTDEVLAFGIAALKRYGILDSGDAKKLGLGTMSDARWKSFYDTMVAAGALQPGLDVKKGYTLQFVNKRVGMS